MNEYLIIMRLDLITRDAQPSPEQLQEYMKLYYDWVTEIQEQGKFAGGKGLSTEGKVIRHGQVVTDGPYAEIKESVAGFIIVQAESFEDAVAIGAKCPILGGQGNSVEIRKVVSVHEK